MTNVMKWTSYFLSHEMNKKFDDKCFGPAVVLPVREM